MNNMTVGELIEKLQKADPDMDVCVLGTGCDPFSNAYAITDVFQLINSDEEENNGCYIVS
jgi:hypothetical protein